MAKPGRLRENSRAFLEADLSVQAAALPERDKGTGKSGVGIGITVYENV